jgi:catechol 2,3-dioxygenase-like lactoylglutathione lyase family enzyme
MTTIRITSLDHLVLTVADVEATASFYERLGMTREVFEGGRLALRFGHQKVNLHQAGAEIEPHALQPTPGSADLCFLVDGPIAAVEAQVRAQGLEIELGPVDRTGAEATLRSLYLRDPDGNLVELSEPGAAHETS